MIAYLRTAGYGALMLGALATLPGCGSRRALESVPGMAATPVARGAEAPETPQDLMAPDMQARPDRNPELLRQSQERQPDPFDLPPS